MNQLSAGLRPRPATGDQSCRLAADSGRCYIQFILNDHYFMDDAFTAFIARMGIVAEHDGMSPIAGRLFALLLVADQPQSLDEIAESLGVSKASVSTDARRLLERGIVERVTRPGDRRDYYELAPDFFARIIEVRVARWRRMQLLANDVRDQAAKLSPTVARRIAAIDDVEASIIVPLEQSLEQWRTQQKQSAADRPPARSPRPSHPGARTSAKTRKR